MLNDQLGFSNQKIAKSNDQNLERSKNKKRESIQYGLIMEGYHGEDAQQALIFLLDDPGSWYCHPMVL